MMIALASDHAGFNLKGEIIEYLKGRGLGYRDLGAYSPDPSDYPQFARAAAKAVLGGECGLGIVVCGTGVGVAIAANRFPGVRAAQCHDVFSAKSARTHNDANILALGERVVGTGHALEIVAAFLDTGFSGDERHVRRLAQMDESV